MKKILLKLKDWIVVWIWFFLLLWIVNAFTIITTVNNWEPLRSWIFNDLINNQSELNINKQNNITWFCSSWEAIKSINNDWTVECESVSWIWWKVVDFKYVSDNTPRNLLNTFPWDDTIPQITEWNEIFSIDISPKKINNILVFEWVVNWIEPTNHSDRFVAALFKDGSNDAISSISWSASWNSWCSWTTISYQVICSFPVKFIVQSDSTELTTYKLRVWLNNWNIYINQWTWGRRLGWTLNSFLSLTEINN